MQIRKNTRAALTKNRETPRREQALEQHKWQTQLPLQNLKSQAVGELLDSNIELYES